jgi:hypothetical protein
MNKTRIEQALIKRGLQGDDLLNALDTVLDIERVGGIVDDEGIATLYHATNPESAKQILKEQKMFGKENGIFFSTKPDGQITGYGSCVLAVRIPVEKLLLDDDFGDELHYRVETKIRQKIPFHISPYSTSNR